MIERSVEGFGLHSGRPVRVVLRKRPGPVTIGAAGIEAKIGELSIASTDWATAVEAHGGALRAGTVEHLFGALAGLGIYQGIAVHLEGTELPLLDGGAAAWCEAIDGLGVSGSPPRSRITRYGVVEAGDSRYEFTPRASIEIDVCLALGPLDAAVLSPEAHWQGDAADFRARIAPARTFVFVRDLGELIRSGLARHVDPASVVVVAAGKVHHAGRAFSPDEPARHKLLDLVGDMYLHGGPPIGRVRAFRPGHGPNARAMRLARANGIVVAE